jgi:hypothetical protein
LVIGLVSEKNAPTSTLSLPLNSLSALTHRHRVPGTQLAIHHNGETVACEVGELEFSTGRRISRNKVYGIQVGCRLASRQLFRRAATPAGQRLAPTG